MGEVWKAEDIQLRRTVAVKFLSPESIDDEEVRARLIREAQASAALDHSNICQVFGIHEEQGETFIAMAYIDGPSLGDKIKERPLPLDEALEIAIQIANGLREAHEKGIVHRDVKPQNVMLTVTDSLSPIASSPIAPLPWRALQLEPEDRPLTQAARRTRRAGNVSVPARPGGGAVARVGNDNSAGGNRLLPRAAPGRTSCL